MKTMKKLVALLLAVMMVLSMSVSVFADPTPNTLPADGSITITNATKDVSYEAYKIFDLTYATNDADSVLGLDDGEFHKESSNADLLAAMDASDVFVVTPVKVDDGEGNEVDSTTDFTVELADGKTEADVRAFMQANADKLPVTGASYTYTELNAAFTALLKDEDYSPFKLTPVPGHEKQYNVEVKDKFTVKSTDSEGVETEEEVPVTGKLIGEWLKKNEDVVKASCYKYTPETTPTAADGAVVIDNLPYGYYYVTSSLGAVVTVDSTLKDVKVVDKNQKPTWDDPDPEEPDDDPSDNGKYMLENGSYLKVNEASIGDSIDFVIPVNATNYNGTNTITDYTIIDKLPEGMTFDQGSAASVAANIKVYVDGVEQTASTATKIADLYNADGTGKYIITMDEDGQGFKIQIPWANKETDTVKKDDGTEAVTTAYVPKSEDSKRLIEVKYSATLNEKATATAANENKAYFTWQEIPDEEDEGNPHDPHYDDPEDPNDPSDDPHDPDEPFDDDDLGKLPTSDTKTYTDQITINKVDPDGNKLTNAEFAIDGTSQNVVVVNSEIYVKKTEMAATDKDYANIEKKDGFEYKPVADVTDDDNVEKLDDTPVSYWDDGEGGYTTENPNVDGAAVYNKVIKAGAGDPFIYYMLKDGSYTKTAPEVGEAGVTGGANKDYANLDQYYKVVKVNELEDDGVTDYQKVGYVDSNGVLTFKGLGAGVYEITEQVAPDGYNRLTDPIKIKVELFDLTQDAADKAKAEAMTEYNLTYATEEAKQSDEAKAALKEINDAFAAATKGVHDQELRVYEWDPTLNSNAGGYKTEALGSGNVTITVVNNTGSELPATGGIGTKIFYVLGGAMLVGAAVLLITKRRMNA